RCPQCKAVLRVPEDLVAMETVTENRKSLGETPATPRPPLREIVNSIGMKLIWMSPGTFLMGSPPEERDRGQDEKRHRVTLTRGLFLGAYPVTQAQWVAVLGRTRSRFKGENRPVENIGWDDCLEFCKKLSKIEGRVYRLPTEAEWEYACRAGT